MNPARPEIAVNVCTPWDGQSLLDLVFRDRLQSPERQRRSYQNQHGQISDPGSVRKVDLVAMSIILDPFFAIALSLY